MKKLGVVLAAGVLAASLALFGCSSNSSSSDTKKDDSAAKTEATASGYTLVKDGTLTMGTSPDYPPFENLENGEAVGFDVDLCKAIADELGLKFEVKSLQFDGIIPAVVAGGQCDLGMAGMSVDPDRAKEVDFTDSY